MGSLRALIEEQSMESEDAAAFQNNGKLYESSKYSDFTIVSGDRLFPVHRAIICPQSQFFDRLCDSSFMETHDKQVRLEEGTEMVERLVMYLYSHKCTISPTKQELHEIHAQICDEHEHLRGKVDLDRNLETYSTSGDETALEQYTDHLGSYVDRHSLMVYVELHVMADKYGIEQLVDLTARHFKEAARCHHLEHWFAETLLAVRTSIAPSKRGTRTVIADILCEYASTTLTQEPIRCLLSRDKDLALALVDRFVMARQVVKDKTWDIELYYDDLILLITVEVTGCHNNSSCGPCRRQPLVLYGTRKHLEIREIREQGILPGLVDWEEVVGNM